MNRFIATLSCLCVLFSFASFAYGQEKVRVKVKHIMGEVAAYDSTVRSMTIKGKKAEILIALDDNTAVREKKDKKTLADIKVGHMVNVKYIETEGRNLAKIVEIKTDSSPLPVDNQKRQ